MRIHHRAAIITICLILWSTLASSQQDNVNTTPTTESISSGPPTTTANISTASAVTDSSSFATSTTLQTTNNVTSTVIPTSPSSWSTQYPETTTTNMGPTTNESVFSVKDSDTGVVCLLAAFNVTFTLPYSKKDGKSAKVVVDFSHNSVQISGSCYNDSETMIIKWTPISSKPALQLVVNPWIVQLIILADSTSSTPEPIDKNQRKYKLASLSLTYEETEVIFPDANSTGLMKTIIVKSPEKLIAASVGETFTCVTDRYIDFTTHGASLELRDLKVDAFRTTNATSFSTSTWLCNEDVPLSSLVPIIVGIVLGLMVIFGLMAYFIGRAKLTRVDTYQSL